MRQFRVLAVILCALATSACSIKFAYNNVDRLVRWQMSDYLDLNEEQRDYLQAEVKRLMAWHRTDHLPQYAEVMYTLADQWSDGVSEAQIEVLFEQMFAWGDEIEQRGMPVAIHILSSLTEEQLAALPAKLERSNIEWSEEELDVPVEEVQAQWAREFEDVLKRFTGRLNKTQRDYLARRAQAYQPERVLWAEYRRRWQADLLKLLEHRADEKFGEQFRALVAARESYYGEEFTRISDENMALGREITAHLLSNLTEKQAERFADSLRELAEDFEDLAAQGQVEEAA